MIARYSRPAMTRVWSDERKLERMLEVELAALDGWVGLGIVSADVVTRIRDDGPPAVARRGRPA